MRTVFLTASAAASAVVLYYLYQRQLGAVSFYLLSIFFFILAMGQFSKRNKKVADSKAKSDVKSEKRRENDR